MSDAIVTQFDGTELEPRLASFSHGEVAMFSSRSPNKQTPNEDCYGAIPLDAETLILLVADGAGGHPNGEEAARLAVECVIEEVCNSPDRAPRDSIVNGFDAGQARITAQLPGAATTMIVVEITNRTARTYHVGDSGACIVGGRGKSKAYTIFHSPTGYATEAGILTEHQAMNHEHRHLVSNLMGDANMSVEIGQPIVLAARDTLVIASDGLFDNLFREEIAAIACARPLYNACEGLVSAATNRMLNAEPGQPSKPDDLTVLTYRQTRG